MNSTAETAQKIPDNSTPARTGRRQTGTDDRIEQEINRFFRTRGRRPRIMLGRSSRGDQRRRVNQVAARFSRYGFDVDISPAQAAPEQLAQMAMENDVHIVCLLFDGTSARRFSNALMDLACDDIAVVVCAHHTLKRCGKDPQAPTAADRINPDDADDVLQLLKEVMTTCPKI